MAKFLKVPICYYPTTVITVDDDELLLESLVQHFSHNHFYSEGFDHSDKLFSFLEKKYNDPLNLDCYLSSLSGEEISNQQISDHPINLNLSGLYRIAYDQNRFYSHAVIVLDEIMKGTSLNGLETAKQIKKLGLPLKIIMLTAQDPAEVGLMGFKNQLIDEFISKQDSDFDEQLIRALYRLTIGYFQDRSVLVNDVLTKEGVSFFSSIDFIDSFNKYYRENNICEHYFNGSHGFLCLNNDAQANLFFIIDDQCIEDQLLEIQDESFGDDVMLSIKNREKVFCFFLPKNKQVPMELWGKFLLPIERVGDYYIATQSDVSVYDLNLEGIEGYNSWLAKLTR